MGFLANYCEGKGWNGQGTARQLWDRTFGAISKERPTERPSGLSPRKSVIDEPATRRLLQALRSQAPGSWTDNRYEQSKAFTSIVYTAGHRKYEQMSQAEFQVFFEDPDHPDGKRPVTRRDAEQYRLVKLLQRPNNEDSFGDLLYNWSCQMDLTGTALTWMVESKLPSALEGKGLPMELYPMQTATCVPQPVTTEQFPDGYYRVQPLYPFGPFSGTPTPYTSVGAPLDARWMLRFKFPHPLLRYEGYSPLTALNLEVDELKAISRSRWYKMLRSFNPTAAMMFDEMEGLEPLPAAELSRIHAEFENSFQGPENHGRLIVCPPGAKLEEFGSRPIDMEYQAGWEQLVSFIMAGLGITKPAAGMIEDSSYATLFATLKQLHLLTLKPMADRFAAKLTRQLAPYFGEGLIVEIRCPRIDDHDVKNAKLQLLTGAGAITYNELRKELDMPLVKEPWGDERVGMDQPEGGPEIPGMSDGVPGPAGTAQPGQTQERMRPADADMEPANAEMTDAAGQRLDEEEAARTQPTPGNLGRGALGPRKALLNGHGKRLNGKARSRLAVAQ